MTHGEGIAEEWFSKFKVYGDVEDGKRELASLIDSNQNRRREMTPNEAFFRELSDTHADEAQTYLIALKEIAELVGIDTSKPPKTDPPWLEIIERIAALEKDKEALDRFSATADALREHLLNNPCLNCDIPDEIYVPFSEAIDAALAPTKTEGEKL